ncbi:MAG: hypothetical protein LUC41_06470, partial [Clostridiales bacterium]|nr:hypothetical protein [Clostridiales bacterium]
MNGKDDWSRSAGEKTYAYAASSTPMKELVPEEEGTMDQETTTIEDEEFATTTIEEADEDLATLEAAAELSRAKTEAQDVVDSNEATVDGDTAATVEHTADETGEANHADDSDTDVFDADTVSEDGNAQSSDSKSMDTGMTDDGADQTETTFEDTEQDAMVDVAVGQGTAPTQEGKFMNFVDDIFGKIDAFREQAKQLKTL